MDPLVGQSFKSDTPKTLQTKQSQPATALTRAYKTDPDHPACALHMPPTAFTWKSRGPPKKTTDCTYTVSAIARNQHAQHARLAVHVGSWHTWRSRVRQQPAVVWHGSTTGICTPGPGSQKTAAVPTSPQTRMCHSCMRAPNKTWSTAQQGPAGPTNSRAAAAFSLHKQCHVPQSSTRPTG